mgnify:CR=1 FL=1
MPLREFVLPLVSSRTLCHVLGMALLVGLYSCIPVAIEFSPYAFFDGPSEFHAVLSLILGWLLVFRTNTAYNRWWEARTLWGGLVNASRNLSLKFTKLGNFETRELRRVQQLLIAFPVALRCHLRSEKPAIGLRDLDYEELETIHLPQGIAQEIYSILGAAKRAGRIDGEEMRAIDVEALRLMDIAGGCERILKTRIVKSYRIFARQCVLIFLASLPWGIVQDFRFWTIPLTILTAYFMLGLEVVAEHVEEPFGYDEDDLDLEGLCQTIALSVNEAFLHLGQL